MLSTKDRIKYLECTNRELNRDSKFRAIPLGTDRWAALTAVVMETLKISYDKVRGFDYKTDLMDFSGWSDRDLTVRAWDHYATETMILAGLRLKATSKRKSKLPIPGADGSAPDKYTAVAILTVLFNKFFAQEEEQPGSFLLDDKTMILNGKHYPLPDVVSLQTWLLETGYPEGLVADTTFVDPETGLLNLGSKEKPMLFNLKMLTDTVDIDTGGFNLVNTRAEISCFLLNHSFLVEYLNVYDKRFVKMLTGSVDDRKYYKKLLSSFRLKNYRKYSLRFYDPRIKHEGTFERP